MRAIARYAAQVLLALSCVAPAWAGESYGTLALQWDNDRFAGTDRHYTNGIGGAWLWAPDKGPAALKRLAAALPPMVADAERRIGVAVGQSIFTPERIEDSDPILDDRPYAGWLYFGLAALSYSDRARGLVAGDLESFEIGLGVVGPAAFAEDVQTAWHEFFEFTRPTAGTTSSTTSRGWCSPTTGSGDFAPILPGLIAGPTRVARQASI